jgi:hypothetical protein
MVPAVSIMSSTSRHTRPATSPTTSPTDLVGLVRVAPLVDDRQRARPAGVYRVGDRIRPASGADHGQVDSSGYFLP